MLVPEVAPGWLSLVDPNLRLKCMVKEISNCKILYGKWNIFKYLANCCTA